MRFYTKRKNLKKSIALPTKWDIGCFPFGDTNWHKYRCLCYLLNAKKDRTMFVSLNGKHLLTHFSPVTYVPEMADAAQNMLIVRAILQ